MKLGLRFDLRAPDFGVPAEELYAAAIDQCEWADGLGFDAVHVAEHHGTEDGYLPSSLVFCAAVAARTTHLRLVASALLIPLHHPLRLAEDLAVLDLISRGRVTVIAGMGYLEREFEMFDLDYSGRASTFEENLAVVRTALKGEPFEYDGRTVVVTPRPSHGGPEFRIGGTAPPSARRAARLGLGYAPSSKELYELYEAELAKDGRPSPEPFRQHTPTFIHLADDPAAAMEVVAPHVMHATNAYARWAASVNRRQRDRGGWREVTSADELMADPGVWIATPEECLRRVMEFGEDDELRFHPLLGGLDPGEAWKSLRLFEERVLPDLIAEGRFQPAGC